MAFEQIITSIAVIESGLIGYNGVSLLEEGTTALTSIAAGSAVEISGSYFKASVDIVPNATSWTAITGVLAYLTLTPSGSAGEQVLDAAWSSVHPVWSTSKQGWYASAASTIRYVAVCEKLGATSCGAKKVLGNNAAEFPSLFAGTNLYANMDMWHQPWQSTSYIESAMYTMTQFGRITVSFDLKSNGSTQKGYGRVYINDVAVGTERNPTTTNTWTTYTEEFDVKIGDKVSIYTKRADSVTLVVAFRNPQILVGNTLRSPEKADQWFMIEATASAPSGSANIIVPNMAVGEIMRLAFTGTSSTGRTVNLPTVILA